jgi:hypothetical protein
MAKVFFLWMFPFEYHLFPRSMVFVSLFLDSLLGSYGSERLFTSAALPLYLLNGPRTG